MGSFAKTEAWFERRGLPHFVESHRSVTEIWSRAIPLLVLFYLVQGLNAFNQEWTAGRNALVGIGGLLILLGGWMLTNRLRRQPTFAYPKRVGPVELGLFVLTPALPPLLFGAQWGGVAVAVLTGIVVLAGLYLVASYGLLSIVKWAGGRFRTLAPTFANLLIRALPLLLLVITVLFLTTETWQFAGTLKGIPYVMVLLAFVLLGGLFLVSRLPGDLAQIGRFDDWSEVHELLPAELSDEFILPDTGDPDEPPLRRRQQLNVGLVMIFSQVIQISLVALSMFIVLVLFGFLAMHLDVQQTWIGDLAPVREYLHMYLGSERLSLTEPLLRVCGFLGAFTGFYFTVYLVTDGTYRDEFRTDVVDEVREAFAVHAAYIECYEATTATTDG
jgi:hypothetical protein